MELYLCSLRKGSYIDEGWDAVGDLHGDFERTQWALQLAGVLSKDGLHRWVGGTTVCYLFTIHCIPPLTAGKNFSFINVAFLDNFLNPKPLNHHLH